MGFTAMAPTTDDVARLAAALRRAAAELGRPCSVGVAELHRVYGGPFVRIANRIGTQLDLRVALRRHLGARWGGPPAYPNGTWHL
jgi:hypothetical protein